MNINEKIRNNTITWLLMQKIVKNKNMSDNFLINVAQELCTLKINH